MKISTRGRYALRFMVDLAQNAPNANRNVTLKDISQRQSISIKYLEQIVTKLCKEGLLKSSRGPQGGYRLVKDPQEYTIGEILYAIEGKMTPLPCLDHDSTVCPRKDFCATVEFWRGLDDVINQYITSVTLEDLASRQVRCPMKSLELCQPNQK